MSSPLLAPTEPVSPLRSEVESEALKSLYELELNQVLVHCAQLQDSGHLQEAIHLYMLWLSKGESAQRQVALFNLGTLQQAAGQTELAIQSYRAAIEQDASLAPAYINLGLSLERQGQLEGALETWGRLVARRYLSARPDAQSLTTALNHIARLLENHRRYGPAEHALLQSLDIDAQQPGVIQHWFHIRQKSCAWPLDKPIEGVSAALLEDSISPLAMLALSEDPARLQANARGFVARTYAFEHAPLQRRARPAPGRLRVGYVSGDFKEHAVGFLLPAFLKEHDRQHFELVAYDFASEDHSDTRQAILAQFDLVRPIHELSDHQAASQIADDGIDILIDLHGLSSGARPGIFSYRPAPRQGTYLGFIGTTALPWIDFVLCDPVVIPPQAEEDFTETPIRMPGAFLPLPDKPAANAGPGRAALGLPGQAFVMCALGNVYKITPTMMRTWLDLLREIDDAVLWLIDDNDLASARLRDHATAQGLPAERLVLSPRMTHSAFCAALRQADVFLDSFPYNCGSTSVDVINADLPMVTLYGRSMVSRMGLSLLTALGQAEWATDRIDVYKRLVHRRHQAWRAGQRPQYNTSAYRLGINEALLAIKERTWSHP